VVARRDRRIGARCGGGASIDAGSVDEPGEAASIPKADVQDAGISTGEAAGAEAPVSDAAAPTMGRPFAAGGRSAFARFDKYASATDLAPDWEGQPRPGRRLADSTPPSPSGERKALHVTGAAGTPTGVIVRTAHRSFQSGQCHVRRMMMWLTKRRRQLPLEQHPGGGHVPHREYANTAGPARRAGSRGYTVRDSPPAPR